MQSYLVGVVLNIFVKGIGIMSATVENKPVSKGYKYFMVFLCMFTQAIPYGIAQNIQSLFVHPLVNT